MQASSMRKQVVLTDVLFARSCFIQTESQFTWSMKSCRPRTESGGQYCNSLHEPARWTESCAVIGYPSRQDGAYNLACSGLSAVSHKENFPLPQKPYNKSCIDQACSVKMAGFWPRSLNLVKWGGGTPGGWGPPALVGLPISPYNLSFSLD